MKLSIKFDTVFKYRKLSFRKLLLKELFFPLTATFLLFILGFFGYIYLEGYTPLESLYMLVITFATIGYGEVQPLSDSGRVFTMVFIILGFSMGLYAISKISAFIIDGELSKILKIRSMNKALSNLKGHYIVCGYGRTGKRVIEDLLKEKYKVVLIDSCNERIEKLKDFYDENLLHIAGDATNDEVLIHAGIEKAKFLISVLPTDAENLYVTLSAKDLNKNIKVISRVEDGSSTLKFKKAGADHIISPNEITSERIISITTTGSDFYDFAEFAQGRDEFKGYKFSLVQVNEGSDLISKTYKDANIPHRTHLIVFGFYSQNNDLQINPKGNDVIQWGDKLLVFGTDEQIDTLKQIANH